jgi:glyoxylase-like metal-dependent hydrolase (beta-lactamase superfamily II)
MNVVRFVSGFLDTNTYLLEEDGHLLIIDPTDYADVQEICRNAASVTVLLTHEHFDHISGLNRIRDLYASSCRVIAGATCSERIQDEKGNLSAYADVLAELGGKQIPEHWSPFVCKAADITFEDWYAFRWMGHAVEMFSTPGHSAGSCCIVVDDLLFVGDTVLENNLMVKFPGSSKKLYRSVTAPLLEKWLLGNRFSCVYPGHGDVMSPEMALRLIRDI